MMSRFLCAATWRPSTEDRRDRDCTCNVPSILGGVGWVVGVALGDISFGWSFIAEDMGELLVKPATPVRLCDTTVLALSLPSGTGPWRGCVCRQIFPSARTSQTIALPGDRSVGTRIPEDSIPVADDPLDRCRFRGRSDSVPLLTANFCKRP